MFNLDFISARNKRAAKECQRMSQSGSYSDITAEIIDDENMCVSITKNHTNYAFSIPRNYPFEEPRVNINGVGHQTYLKIRSPRLKVALKQVSGLDCLCCNTYLCKSNWSPPITMEMIINQLESFNRYKYLTIVKILLSKIKDKYFNRDIDMELETWIFPKN